MLHRFGPLLATALATASACAQYCAVGRATDTCPGGEFISDLVYDDGYGFVDAWNGPCVASGYESLVGTFGFSVYPGVNPIFSVTVANAHVADKVTFWLDADLDGAFGANEAIASNKVGGAYYFAAPPIPACWPYSGQTTMRIALSRAPTGPQPACGTHAFGDWKDVTVWIGSAPGVDPNCPVPAALGTTVAVGPEHAATPTPCGAWSSDLWFSFTPAVSGVYQFSTANSQDWISGVFTYYGGVLTPHFCASGAISFSGPLIGGQTYLLSAGNFSSYWAGLSISLTVVAATVIPSNDECAGAVPVGVGLSPTFSNATASNSPGPLTPCPTRRDLWFSFVPPTAGYYAIGTYGPAPSTSTVGVYDACGAVLLGCDSGYSGPPHAKVVLPLSAGQTYFIQVGDPPWNAASWGPPITVGLEIVPTTAPALTLTVLPGQIGFVVNHGPPGGDYFVAMTLNQGAFPNGWFWGIDATPDELIAQYFTGAPFRWQIDYTGSVVQGPFSGVPPGVTFYAVLLTGVFGGNFLAGTPTSVTTL